MDIFWVLSGLPECRNDPWRTSGRLFAFMASICCELILVIKMHDADEESMSFLKGTFKIHVFVFYLLVITFSLLLYRLHVIWTFNLQTKLRDRVCSLIHHLPKHLYGNLCSIICSFLAQTCKLKFYPLFFFA